MKIEKSQMPKSKPCFKILKLKSFVWHLKIWENQIGSNLKFEIIFFFKSEKWFCTLPPQLKIPPAPLPPGKNFFCNLTLFFYIQFKNIFNLIFPGSKVPSKSLFPKNFKTGLTFWHMWFFLFIFKILSEVVNISVGLKVSNR